MYAKQLAGDRHYITGYTRAASSLLSGCYIEVGNPVARRYRRPSGTLSRQYYPPNAGRLVQGEASGSGSRRCRSPQLPVREANP